LQPEPRAWPRRWFAVSSDDRQIYFSVSTTESRRPDRTRPACPALSTGPRGFNEATTARPWRPSFTLH